MSSSGTPSTGPAGDFAVAADQVLPAKPGLLFYGLQGPADVPFLGGTLCVAPPLARTPVQPSSQGAGPPCSGIHAFAFTPTSLTNAGLHAGQTVHAQFWMRDPAHADATGVGLSNAIEFSVSP